MGSLKSIILYLFLSSLLLAPLSLAAIPSGTILWTADQQTLATIPPDTDQTSQPFLTSPSGNYTAYLVRQRATATTGSLASDFCYVQMLDSISGQIVWESVCALVSATDSCTLELSNAGLEVLDGCQSVWEAGVDGGRPDTLELAEEGDLQIIDDNGVLAWKASDEPMVNQDCGVPTPVSPPLGVPVGGGGSLTAQPVSPPLAAPVGGGGSLLITPPASPPLAAPVGGGGSLPFGQQQPSQGNQPPQPQEMPQVAVGFGQQQQQDQQQQQPSTENGMSQPLVDNNPYDSGSSRTMECWSWTGLVLVALVIVQCLI